MVSHKATLLIVKLIIAININERESEYFISDVMDSDRLPNTVSLFLYLTSKIDFAFAFS